MKKLIKENVESIYSHWYVWLFPIFALIISGFLFFKYFFDHGPTIAITFDEVSVIQPEKTRIRFRGIEIGVVKNLAVSDDRKNVVVYAVLKKGLDDFAVEGAKFWIVTPKVSLQGLTGLDTIFSGPYIEALPGKADAQTQTEFKAKQENNAGDAQENTTSYFIETSNVENISAGDAVTFRGMIVGNTVKTVLNKSGQVVDIQINIQNKYVKLIRTNTVFWRKVGIEANLGLFASHVKVNSLDSIMHGGVEFFTPDNAGPIAKAQTKFPLLAGPPKDSGKWSPKLEF